MCFSVLTDGFQLAYRRRGTGASSHVSLLVFVSVDGSAHQIPARCLRTHLRPVMASVETTKKPVWTLKSFHYRLTDRGWVEHCEHCRRSARYGFSRYHC